MGRRIRNGAWGWEWGKRTRERTCVKRKKMRGEGMVTTPENVMGMKWRDKIMVTYGKNSSEEFEGTADCIVWFPE